MRETVAPDQPTLKGDRFENMREIKIALDRPELLHDRKWKRKKDATGEITGDNGRVSEDST